MQQFYQLAVNIDRNESFFLFFFSMNVYGGCYSLIYFLKRWMVNTTWVCYEWEMEHGSSKTNQMLANSLTKGMANDDGCYLHANISETNRQFNDNKETKSQMSINMVRK